MTKTATKIEIIKFPIKISRSDKVMILGSCFAKEIGAHMAEEGFDVVTNPFGTLYNPISIANSIARMDHCVLFRPEECVEMGAGAGKICSWWHHTSFARTDAADFLSNANRALEEASAFWKGCNKVIITLGTAMVWNTEKTSPKMLPLELMSPAAVDSKGSVVLAVIVEPVRST